jgi:uncharacterized protein (TIGR00255 family)
MKSMTGFGYGEHQDQRYMATIEIKSYNNRYLDTMINLPPGLGLVEQQIRDWLKLKIQRGRVEVSCRIKELETQAKTMVDLPLAQQFMESLTSLRQQFRIRKPVTLDHLLSLEGIIKTDRQRDPEALAPVVLVALEKAFTVFEQARIQEGQATIRDLEAQLQRIYRGLETILDNAQRIETTIQESLRSRFAEVMGQAIDENRILAEAAALIVKHSINEEIIRIKTHLTSFSDGILNDSVGAKQLDFLSQELNREVNTIGSKAFLTDITNEVIQMKDALENIREQLRNLE